MEFIGHLHLEGNILSRKVLDEISLEEFRKLPDKLPEKRVREALEKEFDKRLATRWRSINEKG